jgi:YD repeat-containing protein
LLPFSVLATQNIKVASEDGQEAWVFSPAGRHLQTIDVLTNSMLLTFVYDAAGRLLTVVDVDGNVTTIQRDGTGKPLAIVGPFGPDEFAESRRERLSRDGDQPEERSHAGTTRDLRPARDAHRSQGRSAARIHLG